MFNTIGLMQGMNPLANMQKAALALIEKELLQSPF